MKNLFLFMFAMLLTSNVHASDLEKSEKKDSVQMTIKLDEKISYFINDQRVTSFNYEVPEVDLKDFNVENYINSVLEQLNNNQIITKDGGCRIQDTVSIDVIIDGNEYHFERTFTAEADSSIEAGQAVGEAVGAFIGSVLRQVRALLK